MADLRALLTYLGFDHPRTILQSGNLVFEATAQSTDALEHLLETEAMKQLALQTDFFVRTATEWEKLIARNPFPEEAKSDPGHLVVMFLKQTAAASRIKALNAAITGPEIFRAGAKEAYITYPAGIGNSRLTNTLIEKHLGTRGTGRNWNTVLKLAAIFGK